MYAIEDRIVHDHPGDRRRLLLLGTGAALAVIVAFGLGFAVPVFAYHTATKADAAATDTLAVRFDGTLQQMLTVGFYSPGHTYGGKFSTGSLVAATRAAGGMVLSVKQSAGTGDNTLDVMFGINPPAQQYGAINTDDFQVRCYRYVFGRYVPTVQQPASIACPDVRTDGQPGSVAAQYAALIATQPATTPGKLATNTYPRTITGVEALLLDEKAVQATDRITVIGTAIGTADTASTSGAMFAAAVRINGVCEFVRLASTTAAVVPFWLAPASQQAACQAAAALAESGLYGTDPAQEG